MKKCGPSAPRSLTPSLLPLSLPRETLSSRVERALCHHFFWSKFNESFSGIFGFERQNIEFHDNCYCIIYTAVISLRSERELFYNDVWRRKRVLLLKSTFMFLSRWNVPHLLSLFGFHVNVLKFSVHRHDRSRSALKEERPDPRSYFLSCGAFGLSWVHLRGTTWHAQQVMLGSERLAAQFAVPILFLLFLSFLTLSTAHLRKILRVKPSTRRRSVSNRW